MRSDAVKPISGARMPVKRGEFVAVSFAYAGLCWLSDLAVGARGAYWLGWTPLELGEAIGGWLIYFVPIYLASVIAFALTLCFGRLRQFVWSLRVLSIVTVALVVRIIVATGIGVAAWDPWFVFDALLLTGVIAFVRVGSARLVVPLFTALVSVTVSALILNWGADLTIGGRGDPVVLAALTNRFVLIVILLGSFHVLIKGRRATTRSYRYLRRVLVTLPFLALAAGAVVVVTLKQPLPAGASTDSTAPNLVIVTSDALRADYCSVYGGVASTPSLERLAGEGAKFDRHYSLAPWTLPSMYGMFSSKYPPGFTPAAAGDEIALWKKEASTYALIEEYWTGRGISLAAELKAKGYHTAAIVGNPLLRPDDLLLRDMDELRVAAFTNDGIRGPWRALPGLQWVMSSWWPVGFERRPIDMTRAATQFAEAYLRYVGERPFMLWVHYFDPHAPYDPPKRFRPIEGRWAQYPPGEYHTMAFFDQMTWIGEVPETDRAYVKSLYRGEIEYMDEGVGRILDALDVNELGDNTYVVFSADHGEEFWDHEKWEHGHTLFEDQIKVPLIARGPDILPGTIDSPVSGVDVLPSIRDWLGLSALTGAHGESFAGALALGGLTSTRPVFSHSTSFFTEPLQTVIEGDYKAIHGTHSGEWFLFNLAEDPGEHSDISDGSGDVLSRLQGFVSEWSETFPVTFDQLEIDPEVNRVDEFDEMLRSMGYVN